jgi:hypothetical protein
MNVRVYLTLVRQAQLGASYRVPCHCSRAGSPHRAKPDQQPVPSVAPVAESFKSSTGRTIQVKRTQGTLQAAGETYLPKAIQLRKEQSM